MSDNEPRPQKQAKQECETDDPQKSISALIAALSETLSATEGTNKNLAERIKDLTKRADEAEKLVQAYKKSFESIKKQSTSFAAYQCDQMKAIEAIIRDRKKVVLGIVTAYQNETDEISDPNELRKGLEERQKAVSDARIALDQANVRFDSLVAFQKSVEDALKNMQKLRSDNEKAEDEEMHEHMYFLISTLFKEELEAVFFADATEYTIQNLIKPDEIEGLARQVWDDVNTASKDLQDAKHRLSVLQAQIDSAVAQREKRAAARREAISAKIAEVFAERLAAV